MTKLHQFETIYNNGKIGVAAYSVTRFRVPNGWIYEFPTGRAVFVPDLEPLADPAVQKALAVWTAELEKRVREHLGET